MTRAAALRAWPGWPLMWSWARRLAPWALAVLVLVLVARHARSVDWPQVGQALRALPATTLAAAGGLALLSYALFASYDLIGRHLTRHAVTRRRTLGIAAICYAFNLNFGAAVGALALKLRLYGRVGVGAGTAARVIALSMVTNWLGYLVVTGVALMLAPPPLPAQLPPLPPIAVRALGAVLVALAGSYLLLCALSRRRRFAVRGLAFELPGAGVALWQLAVSAANWSLMATIIWSLLPPAVGYAPVLAVLMLAAIAGVITHVPAGLGVLEAVFVASLGSQVPHATLLAALLAYRAAYYLMPLALAVPGYALSEAAARR